MQSKPLTSHIVCIIYFIHIIDFAYSVESFNDAHEKKKKKKRLSFTAYKPADAKFSWPTFEWEKYREGRIFLSVPSSAFELDRPEKSCAYVFTCTYRIRVFFQELMILYV